MNEAWISPRELGLLIMVIFVPIGPLIITFGSYIIPRGKAKKLTLVIFIFGMVLASILFMFGVIALMFRQPYRVWFMSGFYGLDLIIVLGISYWYWSYRKRIRDTALRKMESEDLTFAINEPNHKSINEKKENSDE